MLFPVSKIFWCLFAPSHVLLWCAIAAAVLLLAHRDRPAAVFAAITAIGFILIGVLPAGQLLMRPLEDLYPERSLPATVTGILTLGGGSDEDIRLIRVWALARAYPTARIVYSGGSGLLLPGAPGHAAKHAAMTFADLGLPPGRLTLEDRSRNTWENIVFSRRLLKPKADEVWVLASSALQLPRAIEVANRQNWRLLPWPTDALSRPFYGGYFDVPQNLSMMDDALHEWIGIYAYRLLHISAVSPPADLAPHISAPVLSAQLSAQG